MMQRWHMPYDEIESRYTVSQILCLTAAMIESSKDSQKTSSGQVTARQFAASMGMHTDA